MWLAAARSNIHVKPPSTPPSTCLPRAAGPEGSIPGVTVCCGAPEIGPTKPHGATRDLQKCSWLPLGPQGSIATQGPHLRVREAPTGPEPPSPPPAVEVHQRPFSSPHGPTANPRAPCLRVRDAPSVRGPPGPHLPRAALLGPPSKMSCRRPPTPYERAPPTWAPPAAIEVPRSGPPPAPLL